MAESLSFLLQKKENAQGKTPKENSLQLCSFHTLARLCSKSFMLGFSSMWTENFQMYKLGLEKAEDQRSNCQHSLDHTESKGIPQNIYFCFIDYTKTFDFLAHNKLWKILKEMGIPDHLTWLLRNLYAGQETTVRTGHGTMNWFQIGKGIHQGCILSPCLFNSYAEYIMRNAGRNINNFRYADDITLMAKSKE